MTADKKTGGSRKGPGLTPEDRDLWQHVTSDTQPLKKREPPPRRDTGEEVPSETPPSRPGKKASAPPATPVVRPVRRPAPAPELEHGTIAGVDRRTAERLKRGQMAIEATLDLHGHTQAAAERELSGFLAEAQRAGRRCVLVITGKGTTKEAGGVLRAQVPRWLNQPHNRARILAFAHAQPKHGGHGALYVLLRKSR